MHFGEPDELDTNSSRVIDPVIELRRNRPLSATRATGSISEVQLTPRYGTDPIISLDGPPNAAGGPLARQQARLVETLRGLDEQQWNHPSRCDGWSVRDVMVHLDSATAFWVFSATQGLAGAPTTFLATFDPVASPAEMVAASHASPTEVIESFSANSAALAAVLSQLDDDGWTTLAEGPPGHISIGAMTHHALWDSWIHERDIVLPLGLEPTVEADEATACLRYAAALSPAFAVTQGAHRGGVLSVTGTDPTVQCRVVVGTDVRVSDGTGPADVSVVGPTTELVEAFSVRRPLDAAIPHEFAWMLDGLATVFDQTPR